MRSLFACSARVVRSNRRSCSALYWRSASCGVPYHMVTTQSYTRRKYVRKKLAPLAAHTGQTDAKHAAVRIQHSTHTVSCFLPARSASAFAMVFLSTSTSSANCVTDCCALAVRVYHGNQPASQSVNPFVNQTNGNNREQQICNTNICHRKHHIQNSTRCFATTRSATAMAASTFLFSLR